jgi:hypothetical protein
MAEVWLRRLGWIASLTRHLSRTNTRRADPTRSPALSFQSGTPGTLACRGRSYEGIWRVADPRVGVCLPQMRSTDSTGWGV